MKRYKLSRRKFIKNTFAGAAGAVLASQMPVSGNPGKGAASDLAINGIGTLVFRVAGLQGSIDGNLHYLGR